jgi:hypothetical protein
MPPTMLTLADELIDDVRFWHLPDIPPALRNVRFWGQSGHGDSRGS